MRHNENEKLVIQTSDSSSICVTQDVFAHSELDYDESERDLYLRYSIVEGYNPLYWCDNGHEGFEAIISILEMPPRNVACKRDYISWWLNCRPRYVDASVSGYLKQRVQFYHTIGEIEKAFRYSRFGLESNPDCLFMWHDILGVSYDTKLLNLIPNNTDGNVEVETITIMFNGFNDLPYTSFNLRLRSLVDFQYLLDYVYGCIRSSVNALSYGNEWILINLRSGQIIRKVINPVYKIDNRTLDNVGIKKGDKLICKLL